jgi:outer membrane protein OmpA-like peptidoglycan-associated protein
MKRLAMWVAVGVLAGALVGAGSMSADQGEGSGTTGGVDVGAVLPLNAFDNYSTTGFVLAPWIGYMFNEYIGVMVQGQGLVAPNRSRGISFEPVSAALAAGVGPRVAVPLGPMEIYGTFQIGGITGLTAPSSITDTAWGFSTGGGVNLPITDTLSIGAWARWNRWYERVRHTQAQFADPSKPNGNVACPNCGDLRYASVGIGVTLKSPPPPPPAPVVAQAPPPPPPPPPPPAKRKIVLRGVNFDFDKSTIRPDARPVLDEAINILKNESGISVVAEGHTDSVGSDKYNQGLSQRRAKAVRDYLVNGGVSSSRIETVGYGESRPVASNDTAEGRAQNRRTELRVKGE